MAYLQVFAPYVVRGVGQLGILPGSEQEPHIQNLQGSDCAIPAHAHEVSLCHICLGSDQHTTHPENTASGRGLQPLWILKVIP